MAKFTLILGNKNYSSWSLRPWLALRQTGVAFDEIVIPLWLPGAREKILSHSPAGKVPILRHGETVIWESLAICEYLAEQLADAGLWPEDPAIRAIARAISHEMHGGFMVVRRAMPMNCRASKPGKGMADGVPGENGRQMRIALTSGWF
ncbi:MAG: glutathione S-transferase [Pseudomonadota bacterium]|nr:glutathione S-transferase [Pseudomonadota bacterium]